MKPSKYESALPLRDIKLDAQPILEDLSHVVPMDVLQRVQDTFSSALGVPIIFVSQDGRPLTQSKTIDSFCWQVARHEGAQQPCHECNRLKDEVKLQCPMDIRDLVLPIEAGDYIVGYLVAAQTTHEKLEEATPSLSSIAMMISRLATARRENIVTRISDPLTGLANRPHFWECLSEELKAAENYNYPVSLLLIDIDDFKQINSVFGHDTGDLVLRTVSEVLKSEIRTSDLCARYNGDSFLVMLRCADATGAEIVAWRLRNTISDLKITARGQLVPIAASVGHVTYPFCAAREPDELFKEVRRALDQSTGRELRAAS